MKALSDDDRERLQYMATKATDAVRLDVEMLAAWLDKAKALHELLLSNVPIPWRCLNGCHRLTQAARARMCRPCRALANLERVIEDITAVISL